MEMINGKRLLLKVVVGSQAYGTNVPGSDVDYKGIYIEDTETVLRGKTKDFIEVNKDENYYEISRFIELIGSSNPNVLEMLFVPEDCIVYKSTWLDELFEKRDSFLTKGCKNSFAGYATQQLKKARGLGKKINIEKSEVTPKTILDFCSISMPPIKGTKSVEFFCDKYQITQNQVGLTKIPNAPDTYQMFICTTAKENWAKGIVNKPDKANQLSLTEVPKGLAPVATLIYNKDGYSTHCRQVKEYKEWLENRNVQRYVDVDNHGQQIDGKNMLHCVRLINMGLDVINKGTLVVRRPESDYLISIRHGKVSLDQLITEAEEKLSNLTKLFKESNLPDKVDYDYLSDILLRIRNKQIIAEMI